MMKKPSLLLLPPNPTPSPFHSNISQLPHIASISALEISEEGRKEGRNEGTDEEGRRNASIKKIVVIDIMPLLGRMGASVLNVPKRVDF